MIRIAPPDTLSPDSTINDVKQWPSWSFARAISPVTTEDFIRQYYGSRPLILHRNNPSFYQGLCELEDFDRVLGIMRNNGGLRFQMVSSKTSESSKMRRPGDVSLPEVYAGFAEGETVRLIGAERFWPALEELSHSIEENLDAPGKVNLFLTPPGAQAFNAHCDQYEVLVFQLHGSKLWNLYQSPQHYPIHNDFAQRASEVPCVPNEEDLTLLQQFTLHQGDFLYLPRGLYHKAITENESSLHVSVVMQTKFWFHLFVKALEEYTARNENMRHLVPPGFVDEPEVQAEMEARFTELMVDFASEASFTDAMQALIQETTSSRSFAADGHFTSLLGLPSIDLDTTLTRRGELGCWVRSNEESAEIRFGSHVVTTPANLYLALDFVANHRSFQVSALPDFLTEQSKVLLAKRLVKEGLLKISQPHRKQR